MAEASASCEDDCCWGDVAIFTSSPYRWLVAAGGGRMQSCGSSFWRSHDQVASDAFFFWFLNFRRFILFVRHILTYWITRPCTGTEDVKKRVEFITPRLSTIHLSGR